MFDGFVGTVFPNMNPRQPQVSLVCKQCWIKVACCELFFKFIIAQPKMRFDVFIDDVLRLHALPIRASSRSHNIQILIPKKAIETKRRTIRLFITTGDFQVKHRIRNG